MLEKIKVVDLIEVTESGHVQVRTKIAIMEDGEEISSQFHRHVIAPGNDYNNENERVKSICAAVHTDKIIASYKATL